MTNESTNKRIYFEHLDYVRFIAALMVVVYHSYIAYVGWYSNLGILSNFTYQTLSPVGAKVDSVIRNLGIGVDVFFLLSGFLITYILLEEKKRYNKINIFKFIVRRTFRIWPLYFFIIAISPFIVKMVESETPNYLANILFVNNFAAIKSHLWTFPFSHFWSICVEEHFYIVWPFIIAFTPRKAMLYVFSLIILFSVAFKMHLFTSVSEPWFPLYLNTISRIDILVVGAIGAYFYSQKPFTFKLNRWLRISIYIALIVAFALEPMNLWENIWNAGFRRLFFTSFIALLLLDFNFNPDYKHVFKPKSIFHYFGKISYGIYMYSNILNLIVIKEVMWRFDLHNPYIYFALTISLSIIIPIISYELMEKHFLKLNKRFRMVKTDR